MIIKCQNCHLPMKERGSLDDKDIPEWYCQYCNNVTSTPGEYKLAKIDVGKRIKDLSNNNQWFIYQGVIDVTENLPFQEIASYYRLNESQYEKLIDYAQTRANKYLFEKGSSLL